MKLTVEIDDGLFPKLESYARSINKTPEEIIKGHIEYDLREARRSIYDSPKAMLGLIFFTVKRLLQYFLGQGRAKSIP